MISVINEFIILNNIIIIQWFSNFTGFLTKMHNLSYQSFDFC